MPEIYGRKIINHRFHIDNDEGESGIGYDMIIGRNLMVQLVLTADFTHQVLKWDSATVHMKESSNFLGQSNLTKREVREVVMQTVEPASIRKATDGLQQNTRHSLWKGVPKQVADDAI